MLINMNVFHFEMWLLNKNLIHNITLIFFFFFFILFKF